MKKALIFLMAVLFFTPVIVLAGQGQRKVFYQQQKAKRQEHSQPKDKVISRVHQKNRDFLKNKLANNTKLTDAQKSELANYMESQNQENISFRDQRHSENVAFFKQIANNPDMTMEQKKAAIKAHREEEHNKTQEYFQEQKVENKSEKEKIRSEIPTQP